MNIIILSPFNPFSEESGSNIRLMNLIQSLEGNRIFLLSFYEKEEKINSSNHKNYLEGFYLFKKPSINSLQTFFNHFSFKPLLTKRFYSKDALKTIQQLIKTNSIDFLIMETLLMAEYAKSFDNLYRILDEHNIEFIRAKRRVETTKSIFKKIYYYLIYFRLKRYELKTIKRYEACFVCSETDKSIIKKYLSHKEVIVIPNTVDINYFYPQGKEKRNLIVFVGTMWYEPNLDAVKFFIKEIFPLVKRKMKDVKFLVMGKGLPESFISKFDKEEVENVEFKGYVEDVRDYLSKALVFVAPLRVGSGTRFKILVAMAMGLAVVSTSLGCEGLEVKDNENICIADTPDDFASRIVRLIEDKEFREKIEKNGRKLVEEKYSNEILKMKINEFLKNALTKKKENGRT